MYESSRFQIYDHDAKETTAIAAGFDEKFYPMFQTLKQPNTDEGSRQNTARLFRSEVITYIKSVQQELPFEYFDRWNILHDDYGVGAPYAARQLKTNLENMSVKIGIHPDQYPLLDFNATFVKKEPRFKFFTRETDIMWWIKFSGEWLSVTRIGNKWETLRFENLGTGIWSPISSPSVESSNS
jgi:hypothetical protein